LLLASPALAQDCQPMTAGVVDSHTRPPRGDELLHPGEIRYVGLKAVIRPDGGAQIEMWRSSGVTALNDVALGWVQAHWRWPQGCPPGTTRRIAMGFRGW
jgi:hypothetical protein